MNGFTIIGLTAAACTTAAFIPQAIKVIRTKDTRSLSLPMYIIFTVGVLLWLVYGILVKDIPVMAANVVTLTFSLVILVSIIIYRKKADEI